MRYILYVFVGMFCLAGSAGQAQSKSESSKKKKEQEILIQTTAQCEMCKDRIERTLSFEKGVKSAILQMDDKRLRVVFNPKKTDPEKIKKAVSAVGYQADEVKANADAYQKLPGCCKIGGHDGGH